MEKTNPAFIISDILFQLEQSGATIGAIPCNTAHADEIFSVIKKELRKRKARLKLIDMIGENVKYIQEAYPDRAVGVLSTKGTKVLQSVQKCI